MSSADKSSTSKVQHVFEGRPSFYCSNCSAVIASISPFPFPSLPFPFPLHLKAYIVMVTGIQALKDELISKSFSGRDGRG